MGIVKDVINSYKCNYCMRIGAYTDWFDGKEISVCFKHLAKHNSE